ncbi:MAG: hypothetical protein GY801_21940 [bacterium]|nr:hypothetical protein [bacterium]
MLALEVSKEIEQHFHEVVQTRYHGDVQEAMMSLLRLYDRYGWKEQLRNDVESIRAEVHRQGGISDDAVDDAIAQYRRRSSVS